MEERPLSSIELKPEEWRQLRGFSFVTLKPQIILLNLDESQNEESKIPKWEALKSGPKSTARSSARSTAALRWI